MEIFIVKHFQQINCTLRKDKTKRRNFRIRTENRSITDMVSGKYVTLRCYVMTTIVTLLDTAKNICIALVNSDNGNYNRNKIMQL